MVASESSAERGGSGRSEHAGECTHETIEWMDDGGEGCQGRGVGREEVDTVRRPVVDFAKNMREMNATFRMGTARALPRERRLPRMSGERIK